jgi:hypothetical protein
VSGWARRAAALATVLAGLAASTGLALTGVTTAGAVTGPGTHAAAARAAGAARAARAARVKYCGSHEITVVVDLTHFQGGKVRVGCAKSPGSGLGALHKAGFPYSFVPRQPGFVCTIRHRPSPCNGAPASAYWAYFHARKGGKWLYSKTGAGSYHPKRGQIEGWAFGRGRKPRVSPP